MKVIFIGSIHNSVEKYLTKYKWYVPIEYIKGIKPLSKDYYVIINDYDQKRRYKVEYFMTLEQLRDSKINKILGI